MLNHILMILSTQHIEHLGPCHLRKSFLETCHQKVFHFLDFYCNVIFIILLKLGSKDILFLIDEFKIK